MARVGLGRPALSEPVLTSFYRETWREDERQAARLLLPVTLSRISRLWYFYRLLRLAGLPVTAAARRAWYWAA